MSFEERVQQVAVLLNLIGEEAADVALENFEEAESTQLKSILKEFKSDPPSESEIKFVLDDFERYFAFAMQYFEGEIEKKNQVELEEKKQKEAEEALAEEEFEVDYDAIKVFPIPELTGDLKHDLTLLHPYQVAYAIRNDSPKAIATVIACLVDRHAAKTLEYLPDDVRMNVFIQMTDPSQFPPKVEQQILQATLDSALKIESRAQDGDYKSQLVALTRSLPKNVRGPLIDKLIEENEDLASEIKESLFQFDDILKLGDRDIQKVLGQSDSDSLVLSLVKAEDAVKERILGNMSKRARQTIEDELEFKTNASTEEIESGEKQVVTTMMELEEAGEISFE